MRRRLLLLISGSICLSSLFEERGGERTSARGISFSLFLAVESASRTARGARAAQPTAQEAREDGTDDMRC